MAPSGSKETPVGDGNTKSPTSREQTKRDAGKKHWFITLKWTHGVHYPYFVSLQSWLQLQCTRAVFSLEKGDETGYEHLQLQLSLKTKQRFNWFKHHLSPVVHCEVTRNIENAYDYCAKEETRIWGPWQFPAPPAEAVVDPMMKHASFHKWQQDIIDIINAEPHERHIHWFWEPKGSVGKTQFAKHLIIRYGACFLQGGKKSDMAYAWKGQRLVVFNFSRDVEDRVSYDAIESLKDGLIFSPKYESGVKLFNVPHVIVFANWEPMQERISADKWIIRRISE